MGRRGSWPGSNRERIQSTRHMGQLESCTIKWWTICWSTFRRLGAGARSYVEHTTRKEFYMLLVDYYSYNWIRIWWCSARSMEWQTKSRFLWPEQATLPTNQSHMAHCKKFCPTCPGERQRTGWCW